MATIPELRPRLLYMAQLLEELGLAEYAAELRWIEQQLHRRKATRRAPAKPVARTEEFNEAVRRYVARNPTTSYQDIGTEFGINSGRVSEIVAGVRK